MNWNKIYTYSTISLGLFPLLKLSHYSLLMMLWVIISIRFVIKNKTYKNINRADGIKMAVMTFPFWSLLLYLPFAEDYKNMGNLVNRSLPFLFFSVFFVLNAAFFTKKTLNRTINIMVLTTVFIVLKSWMTILLEGFGELWRQNSFYNPVFRNIFQDNTNIHLPYLGLICILASLLLIYKIVHYKRRLIIYGFTVLFLVGSVYLFSARMALICFLIGFIGILINRLKSLKLKIVSIIAIPVLAFFIVWVSPLKERYNNLVELQTQLPKLGMKPHEVNYRYAIFYCTKQLLQEHWIAGIGPDKIQNSLDDCYSNFSYKGYDDFQSQKYNTHNQYFDYWLKYGVIGLLLFVSFLFFFMINGFYYHKLFILIFAVSLFTENLFDRQLGVVLFTFFNAIFVVIKKQRFEKSIGS